MLLSYSVNLYKVRSFLACQLGSQNHRNPLRRFCIIVRLVAYLEPQNCYVDPVKCGNFVVFSLSVELTKTKLSRIFCKVVGREPELGRQVDAAEGSLILSKYFTSYSRVTTEALGKRNFSLGLQDESLADPPEPCHKRSHDVTMHIDLSGVWVDGQYLSKIGSASFRKVGSSIT